MKVHILKDEVMKSAVLTGADGRSRLVKSVGGQNSNTQSRPFQSAPQQTQQRQGATLTRKGSEKQRATTSDVLRKKQQSRLPSTYSSASFQEPAAGSGRGQVHVGRVMFSPDGQHLLTVLPGKLEIWEASSGKHCDSIKAKDIKPSTVILSSRRGGLIFGCVDNISIDLWDVRIPARLHTMFCDSGGSFDLNGYSPIRQRLALSPNENVLAVVHYWHMEAALEEHTKTFLTFFDMLTRQCTGTVNVSSATITPGPRYAAGAASRTDFSILPYMLPDRDTPDHFFGVVFTPDGKTVVLTVKCKVFLVSVASRAVREMLAADSILAVSPLLLPVDGGMMFAAVASQSSGQAGTVASQARTLQLWSSSRATEMASLENPSNILSFALSADCSLLAVVLANSMVMLWDVALRRPVLRASAGSPALPRHQPAFSPDGRFFATYHTDACRVWEVPAKYVARCREGAGGGDYWEQFGVRGQRLWARTGGDRLGSVWDAPSAWPNDLGLGRYGYRTHVDGTTLLSPPQELGR